MPFTVFFIACFLLFLRSLSLFWWFVENTSCSCISTWSRLLFGSHSRVPPTSSPGQEDAGCPAEPPWGRPCARRPEVQVCFLHVTQVTF